MIKYLLLLGSISICNDLMSQKRIPIYHDHDSSYYISYRDRVTARAYLSRKYTILQFNPPGDDVQSFKYKANTSLNIGLGATYKSFTVNIGVGINKFNPDQEKGITRYLDFQSRFYARQWNFDLLGQFYRGYYLSPKGLGFSNSSSYYVREDMRLQMGGIAAYRALNDRKFSYQAGLLQNEWQRKSAGSLLVGAEVYYGAISADSSLVPKIVDSDYYSAGIKKLHFLTIGPGMGYAYTLVWKQHFFLLASATVNFDLRYAREKTVMGNADRIGVTPNFIFHAGTGYNGRKWNLTLLWVQNGIGIKGRSSDYKYQVNIGNYRLMYAQRFSLDRRTKKIIQPLEEVVPGTN
jgi:hypothetical protein